MNTRAENSGYNGFLIGLLAGSAIGAAVALALTPKAGSELRKRIRRSASELGDAATQSCQEVTTRIVGVVDDVTARGNAVRDEVADAVGRGAREVEQFAKGAKSR